MYRAQQAIADAEASSAAAAKTGDCAADPLLSYFGDPGESPLPDDSFPIAVVRTRFQPPAADSRSSGALLSLEVADLVRITTPMDTPMCYGFVEGVPTKRGWFPKNNIEVLEDPLDTDHAAPVQVRRLELPRIPAFCSR